MGKALIVAWYEDLLICGLEVVIPIIHCLPDGHPLPIIRVKAHFGSSVSCRAEVDWLENPECFSQAETASDRAAASIGFQNHRLCGVQMPENGCMCVGSSALAECELGIASPFPFRLCWCPGILQLYYKFWYRYCYRCTFSNGHSKKIFNADSTGKIWIEPDGYSVLNHLIGGPIPWKSYTSEELIHGNQPTRFINKSVPHSGTEQIITGRPSIFTPAICCTFHWSIRAIHHPFRTKQCHQCQPEALKAWLVDGSLSTQTE